MKRQSFTLLSLLLLILCPGTGHAQGRLFTTDNELSCSLINKIYEDTHGIIWIATEDGLNRYDGAKFTVFKHRTADPHSLLSNYVRTLYEDSRGRLWVGTLTGLQYYDRATEQFYNVPLLSADNNPTIRPNIGNVIERANGDVWISAAGHGIHLIEEEADSLIARQRTDILPPQSIGAIYEDSHGYLWIATGDNGIYRMDANNQYRHYPPALYPTMNRLSPFCEDRQGTLYVGSLTHGLFRYDAPTDRFVAIPYPHNPYLPIKVLHADGDHLLVGTDGNGMKVYDIHTHTFVSRPLNITTFDPRQAKIHSILKDRAGNLWYGLFQKGVLITPPIESDFRYIGYQSATHNLIGSGCVMSVSTDHNGTLWVGTDNDGLYGINPDGTLRAHFAPDTANPHAVPATIMSIFEDSRHNLWLGSYLNGMARLDPRTGQCEYIRLTNNRNEEAQSVYCFAEDRHGNLWIGTMGNGLFRLHIDTRATESFTGVRSDPGTDWDKVNHLHNSWINCLLYSAGDDRLYFGTFDGIGCLDVGTLNFVTPLGTRRLLRETIYTLYSDRQGDIWAGTVDGLRHISLPSQTVRAYTQADGLPSDLIRSIEADSRGMLWISTGYGISRFNPTDSTFANYYAGDGLQGNEFSRGASYASPTTGALIFGGMNGITSFLPEEIHSGGQQPTIRITDFRLHNRAVRKGTRSGGKEIIDTAVSDADRFELSYRDNSFSIELSAMEFYNPEHVTYLYALNDNQWISLQPGIHTVSFGDLQPGTYRFRFKARKNESESDIREIKVVIAPPWYTSPWAKLTYTLLALAALLGIVLQVRNHIRVRQERVEHRHAEEINKAKLQFFTDISHEIRTPMSLIISPIQTLMATDRDRHRGTMYRTIYRNAERILQLINQLMDMRKIDRGQMRIRFSETDLTSFLQELYVTFTPHAEAKQITMRFVPETPEAPTPVWIDPSNFDKVIVNVLANALKFTPQGGEITISLRTGNDPAAADTPLQHFVEIVIADSGIGIAPEELEHIFDRFYQIRNQMSPTFGTGIGLHLCRSLMTLHHGTIHAGSNGDQPGTRFIIRLPQGKAHLSPDEINTDTAPTAGSLLPIPHPIVPANDISLDADWLPADNNSKGTPRQRRRLLIVEDDAEIQAYLYHELKKDYYISACNNGKEALEEILKQQPDLVISDIMMPEMDGLLLCRKIKQNVRINHLPVILLTAKNHEEDKIEGLSTGADAYIIKPFSIEIVRKTIENLIAGRNLLRSSFSGSQLQENKLEQLDVASPDEQLMERVMKFVNANLGNPKLSVDLMAKEVGLSRVHLYRKLKEITNQAPRDFIRNLRLKQAATLLSEKRYNISEIADLTGFNSPVYFATLFKEMYGMLPKEWMERQHH
ncbi:MAG: response regulator [Prevotellaceae bacterium]|nr:response regulator [Prevotellaceae bacterium]